MNMNTENLVNRGVSEEVVRAQSPEDKQELKAHLSELLEKSPSRIRARYTADFSLTPEYEALSAKDTKTMTAKEKEEHIRALTTLKRVGTYTDTEYQRDIDNSLELPLSEIFQLRDKYKTEILNCEKAIDNFSSPELNARAEALALKYKNMAKGKHGIERARLQTDYDNEYNELKQEEKRLKNIHAVKRAIAIRKYSIYENRIKLFITMNRDAIQRQLDNARDQQINENLLALAEYMEE